MRQLYVYETEPLVDVALFLPECSELDLNFFNATYGIPLYPIGISFQPITRADNQNFSPLDFFIHDALGHALRQRASFLYRMRLQSQKKGAQAFTEKEWEVIQQLVNAYGSSEELSLESNLVQNEQELFEAWLFQLTHETARHPFSLKDMIKSMKMHPMPMSREETYEEYVTPEMLLNFLIQETKKSDEHIDKDKALNDINRMYKKIESIAITIMKEEKPKIKP